MTTFVRHETRRWRYFLFTKFKTVVDNERNRRFESVYSKKVRAGKRRTYFFDVRKTKGEDFYLTLTESTKRFNGEGYERHKIFLYKEDFNRFLEGLEEAVNYIKTELMPNYDYDEFARRHDEDDYEEDYSENNNRPTTDTDKAKSALESDDDDMSW